MRGSSKRRPEAEQGARLLQQQIEMGGRELFMDRLTREQALALAAAARSSGSYLMAVDTGVHLKSLPVLPTS